MEISDFTTENITAIETLATELFIGLLGCKLGGKNASIDSFCQKLINRSKSSIDPYKA
ncbi:hypothetical protein [uncultured Paraglaciecola sp.]|uniref:hypothetical protein n=1 Tax=uncultured Paraglaciecola sp. TaxID=1765024 RepID=UPI002610E98A|nr:hypothetical protein [uncultured Paraglaciecola sp.]